MSTSEQNNNTETVNVYSYDDFRLYIKERYEAQKRVDPGLTCRKFAGDAGFTNPGFVGDVISGRRRLSPAAVQKICAAFRLNPSETDYFVLLVRYGQSKKERDRQEIYKKILFRRNRSQFAKLNPALSRYYQDYRYPLVYNAVMACDFRGDYEKLSGFIYPSIPPAQLKRYVRELCDWGIVRQEPDGRYTVTERFVEPPSTLREEVRQLHKEWIAHASDALMSLPPEKRHISSMLLSTSPKTSREISEKIEKFREEIWQMVKEDPAEPSCVMQLNMQYIPRSRKKERV